MKNTMRKALFPMIAALLLAGFFAGVASAAEEPASADAETGTTTFAADLAGDFGGIFFCCIGMTVIASTLASVAALSTELDVGPLASTTTRVPTGTRL